MLAEQPEVLEAAFHRVDEFFATVVPDEHHKFQQPAVSVETETEEPARVGMVQRDRYQRPGRRLDPVSGNRCPPFVSSLVVSTTEEKVPRT